MNEEKNINTSPKPKRKRSFWWLKLLLILILFAAGIIAGIMLSSQAITNQIIEQYFPQYAVSSTENTQPVEAVLPTAKPIEFATPAPSPKPSKAPVEIISPEKEEKSEAEEFVPVESAEPVIEEKPEVSAQPEKEEAPASDELPDFTPAKEEAAAEEVKASANAELIGIDAALEAALNHAKLDESTVVVYGVSREKDEGIVYYEVEFAHGMLEYEYEINAYTGAVEGWKTVRDKNFASAAVQPALSEGSEQPEYVSPTDAMEAALSHAGYRQHETTDMKVELEIDKNKVVYDVEFWAEGYDYDYKVDAQSGLVLMVEKDRG